MTFPPYNDSVPPTRALESYKATEMPLPAAAKKGSTLKKKASLSRNASLSSPPTATTLSSDANARQVTRAEFQELTFVVAQLKKDLVRNQTLGKLRVWWAP